MRSRPDFRCAWSSCSSRQGGEWAAPPPHVTSPRQRRRLGDWQLAAFLHARPLVTASSAPPGDAARGAMRVWSTGISGLSAAAAAAAGTGRLRRLGPRSERDLSISVASSLQTHSVKGKFSLSGSRKLFFDTHALVCLLEENGFTTQQSEIIVSALVKIMNTNMDVIYKDMVTKVQQKVKLELQMLKKQVTDEVTKVRADNKLGFNLEKSRVKELYSVNEKKLLEIRTEIVALHAQQDRALTQTDRKIDTEVAGLKTMLESHKLDNIKYLAGSVFTCLTVALGFYRLWI
ncbi:mitochondrial calcium uniporter regulator 1 isoform X3 [Lepidochelys kempii]|uniref:mitochondrial calcium uniporter regulator 1 isoform X3 n=1 Tax=Lepidochelys kempii TaxID=8472 RepID=UPI003C6F22D2